MHLRHPAPFAFSNPAFIAQAKIESVLARFFSLLLLSLLVYTMTDKEMLGGIQLEDDMWANCVTIILGLIGKAITISSDYR